MSKQAHAFDESEHVDHAKPSAVVSAEPAMPSLFDAEPEPDHRLTQELKVLEKLALIPPGEPASRARIAALTLIARETLCRRLDRLTKEGYIAMLPKSAKSHSDRSLSVNGYVITPSGRDRLERAA
jgi:hypothetical protein